jgi:hypothetical protein
MSDREDRLRSLLNKVRAKRPDERTTRAADALDRIRTASGTTAAAQVQSSRPAPIPSSEPAPISAREIAPSTIPPTSVPSSFSTQLPSSPLPEPPTSPSTSPSLESPTRYSSQPPRVERPLSVEPRARSVAPSSSGVPIRSSSPASSASSASGAPVRPSSGAPSSRRPESIRPQSVAPTGQPVVYATDPPEFPRAKTFGDLLELTLSLRPR